VYRVLCVRCQKYRSHTRTDTTIHPTTYCLRDPRWLFQAHHHCKLRLVNTTKPLRKIIYIHISRNQMPYRPLALRLKAWRSHLYTFPLASHLKAALLSQITTPKRHNSGIAQHHRSRTTSGSSKFPGRAYSIHTAMTAGFQRRLMTRLFTQFGV
jgi:hypothetical protein